ncbi:hypothetical protein BC833DRAFT_569801, partial [Globomyces pollinis-pini]
MKLNLNNENNKNLKLTENQAFREPTEKLEQVVHPLGEAVTSKGKGILSAIEFPVDAYEKPKAALSMASIYDNFDAKHGNNALNNIDILLPWNGNNHRCLMFSEAPKVVETILIKTPIGKDSSVSKGNQYAFIIRSEVDTTIDDSFDSSGDEELPLRDISPQTKQFWRSSLQGVTYQQFPLLSNSQNRTSDKWISNNIVVDMEKMKQLTRDLQITVGTVIHTAWSILLYYYSRNEKLVFGNVTSGRDSGIDGIESVAGILINTIPIVATIKDAMTVKELL